MNPAACPHNPRRPCPRCARILTLLDHLEDTLPAPALGIATGDGNGVTMMPPMYHHIGYRQLRITLGHLYDHDRTAHAHLMAYYKSEWRIVQTQRRIRTRKGIRHEPGPPKRQRVINSWVIPEVKQRGEIWVMRNYPGEPFLPDELMSELASEHVA